MTSDNSTQVTLSRTSGSGTLGGTLTKTVSAGIATFDDITATKAENLVLQVIENQSGQSHSVSKTVSVLPSAASHFVVSGISSPIRAGTADDGTVTAYDAYNNLAFNYTGTVHFTSTDMSATLPEDITFGAGDLGIRTFSVTLKTAGTHTVAVTDSVAGISGFQDGIVAQSAKLMFTNLPAETPSAACLSYSVAVADAANNIVAADSALTVTIGASGDARLFSDPACENALEPKQVSIASGQSSAAFRVLDPTAETLTLTATDASAILTQATLSGISITPSVAWVGATSTPVYLGGGGNAIPGDGDHQFNTPKGVSLDSGNYLYVADSLNHRIQKFDENTGTYVGWIGMVQNTPAGGAAGCSTAPSGSFTPGWCKGGTSKSGAANTAGLYEPGNTAVDDTYLYVSDNNNHRVIRYVAATGACAGWIGKDTTTACSGVANSFTGGWCACGTGNSSYGAVGDGSMRSPAGITVTGDSLYLNDAYYNRINKYNKSDGSFIGWVGLLGDPTGASCAAVGTGNFTGGWCIGGTSLVGSCATANGGLDFYGGYETGIFATATDVYTIEYGCNRVSRFSANSGSFITAYSTPNTDFATALAADSSYFYLSSGYVPSLNRHLLSTGVFDAWIGKIRVNGGTCTAGPGNFTGGWCSGGVLQPGSSDGAFSERDVGGSIHQIDASSADFLYVSDTGNHRVNKFRKDGTFVGWIGSKSVPQTLWQRTKAAATGIAIAFGNMSNITLGDDSPFDNGNPLNSPMSVVKIGSSLWIANSHKINRYTASTGDFEGWYGLVGRTPTGGDPGCTTAAKYSMTPGFCKGGLSAEDAPFYSATRAGLDLPHQSYFDGTHLYVVQADYGTYRVNKYHAATNAFVGWIGRLNSTTGASCAAVGAHNFTGGWCTGGTSENGLTAALDGTFAGPYGIAGDGTSIYVSDMGGHRINKYDAASGIYLGWIGYNSSATGCLAQNAFNGGWCFAGTSAASSTPGGLNVPRGLYVDATNDILYVANSANHRIEKYTASTGVFLGWMGRFILKGTCTGTNGAFSNGWCNSATATSQQGTGDGHMTSPHGVIVSGGDLYVADSGNHRVSKYTAQGVFVGWMGNIRTNTLMGGACSSSPALESATPGWCTGGTSGPGNGLGMFNSPRGLEVDSTYLYVTDFNNHRVVRVPR